MPGLFPRWSKDLQTHCKVTEDYYNLLKAPAKDLYWFENSGHNLTTSDPVRLQEIVINDILPKINNGTISRPKIWLYEWRTDLDCFNYF